MNVDALECIVDDCYDDDVDGHLSNDLQRELVRVLLPLSLLLAFHERLGMELPSREQLVYQYKRAEDKELAFQRCMEPFFRE